MLFPPVHVSHSKAIGVRDTRGSARELDGVDVSTKGTSIVVFESESAAQGMVDDPRPAAGR